MQVAGMTIDIRNGLTPSLLRVLMAVGWLQSKQDTVTLGSIADALVTSEAWSEIAVKKLTELGLLRQQKNVNGRALNATITPACRFFTLEQLKEEHDGTARDATTAVDGSVQPAVPAK